MLFRSDKSTWYFTPVAAWSDLRFAFAQDEADVDLTVRRGSLKKHIKQERMPLDQLTRMIAGPENKK